MGVTARSRGVALRDHVTRVASCCCLGISVVCDPLPASINSGANVMGSIYFRTETAGPASQQTARHDYKLVERRAAPPARVKPPHLKRSCAGLLTVVAIYMATGLMQQTDSPWFVIQIPVSFLARQIHRAGRRDQAAGTKRPGPGHSGVSLPQVPFWCQCWKVSVLYRGHICTWYRFREGIAAYVWEELGVSDTARRNKCMSERRFVLL